MWSRQNAPISTDQHRSGKWMLFPRCGQAVPAWRIVVQAGDDGKILLAKISPQATRGSHLICVYTPDFTDQPKVANGASELMQQVFGEIGRHARSAVGVAVLPLGVAVEVDAIVAVKA